ncbi:hypothetical protein [Pleurocapsa sp. PCC 7319]|uniref:hypothetical protein n=1 Tax=Pleurocapsa sp. PCC 7319 TaxID=118161 RepID=UPI0003453AC1|nr:hypothetical protein [Pleurocapsa sp. PCC 7319]
MSIIFDLSNLNEDLEDLDNLDDIGENLNEDLEDLDNLDDIGENLNEDLEDLDEALEDLDEDLDDIGNDGNNNSSPEIIISDAEALNNITFTYEDEDGTETFSFERPQAVLNIFDSQYYLNNNPDVAEDIDDRYEDANVSIDLTEVNLLNVNNNTESLIDYGGSIEHYVANGASEGRDPSPLFDTQYYLEQNPDVASALAGGNFSGDPLLHYVQTGAFEGRDPNPYFDSDYYLEQNSGITEAGLNPLEHYVLFGSSAGINPSPNFDPNYYLSQNLDVASAGIDPLTHFLTFGQDEGRLPMAD